MKSRGLEQVELFLSDGVVGYEDSAGTDLSQSPFSTLSSACHAQYPR